MTNEGVEAVRRVRVSQAGRLTTAVVALALGLTACGSKDTGTTGTGTSPVSVPAASAPSGSASASSNNTDSAGGARTPGEAVSAWVTQILQEEYTKACQSSAVVAAEAGQDPATMCESGGGAVSSMKHLHDAWAKPGITLPPAAKVKVDDVDPKGDTATVPDTSIKLGDKSLRDLELIGSSGDTSSFRLDLQVVKKDGAWYVGGMDISA
ncbi:hypothetical protein [Amycolatopsis taiwanensis]|uniref:hypothetical protein n=1 Tax=Amycolatopsis taiwanensis TaxID=342230 RepID=UPI001FE168CC|nr:hypothetical protein [Amycolatopsis taiwanensis]